MLESCRRWVEELRQQFIQRDAELVRQINEVVERQRRMGSTDQLQIAKEFNAQMYQNAMQYTNLVIVAGYAGFFGLWQITKDVLKPWEIRTTGALMAISLFCFIAFEIYKMIIVAVHLRAIKPILSAEVPEERRVEVWSKLFKEYDNRFAALWIWFLVPCVATGTAAGVILLVALIAGLF